MQSAGGLMTLGEYRAMPDPDQRYELVRGVPVWIPFGTPRHGVVCGNVLSALERWNRRAQGGFVCAAAGVITSRNPDSVRAPDGFFVRADRRHEIASFDDWLAVPPDLVFEVRSELEDRAPLLEGVDDFLAFGVHEAWILELDERSLEVRRGGTATTYSSNELVTSPILCGFESCIRDFFRGL